MLARARGQKLALKKPPRPKSIKAQERAYASELLAFLEVQKRAVETFVVPAVDSILASSKNSKPRADADRSDDFVDQIEEVMRLARIQSLRQYSVEEIARLAKKAAVRVSDFNESEFARSFGAVLEVNLARVEPWLDAEIKSFEA